MKIFTFIAWISLIPSLFLINYLLSEFTRPNDLHHYIFYLRAPLISGILLIVFPLIAIKTKISALLRNLFVMSQGYQVAMGVFAALVAARAIIVAISAIIENAPARFSIKTIGTIVFPYDYLGLTILGLPIIYGIISETRIERKWWSQQNIDKSDRKKYAKEIIQDPELYSNVVIGVLSSIAVFIFEGAIFQVLKISSPLFVTIANYLLSTSNYWIGFDKGYIDDNTKLLSHSHLTSIAFFITGLLLFWTFHYLFSPFSGKARSQLEAPVLVYISATFALLVTWFEGINFYADKFHFPVFLSFFLFSGFSYWIWQVDHFFELSKEGKSSDDSPLPDNFYTAIDNRLGNQCSCSRTLVVITASGGGIHAAGWTAQVLTGLQKLLGSEFTNSIGLISGVSGGSVGTMYFLDKCGHNGYPEQEDLPVIVQNAVQDGLDAIGWGLVYRDLWRFIGIPWLLNKYEDRGTALEKNWQGHMDQPNTTLSYWRKKALAGEIPIPVFNATLIEDGRRLLVSPMTFATKDKNDRTIDFNTLYQKGNQRYDLKVVTAARLSATFPYVSPSPRNSDIEIERNYHIADGGYFDNSGVVTVIEWLEANYDNITNKDKLNIRKLVFIEIEAQETPELSVKVKSGGWFITIFGAIQALFSVRSASLLLRNQQEIDLLLKHYRSELDDINPSSNKESNVQYLRIDFPQRSKSRFKIVNNKKVGEEYSQPLSWKLTASQKYVLQEAWQDLLTEENKDESMCSVKKLAGIWKHWRSSNL